MKKRIEWEGIASVMKATEGGPGGKLVVEDLREAGIKARTCHSPYVGHVGIEIANPTEANKKKALKVIFG